MIDANDFIGLRICIYDNTVLNLIDTGFVFCWVGSSLRCGCGFGNVSEQPSLLTLLSMLGSDCLEAWGSW